MYVDRYMYTHTHTPHTQAGKDMCHLVKTLFFMEEVW